MKAKLYNKSQKNIEDVKKVIIYWLERIEREEDGKKITLFFDMDGCGLNMDIEVIMFMVTLLKSYYPNMINYVIVFQLPWMLTAGFKIVKGSLPAAAVERLRMVSKDKLKDLVAPEQALASWGGKDNYVFEFIPEKQMDCTDKATKHVSFSHDTKSNEMLLLSPSKTLIFSNDNEKISAYLTVTNREESCVAFKIRTTAPEKYVVRPSSGMLNSKASQTINIFVNSGFPLTSVETDRFLVVSMKIPNLNMSQNDIGDLWKAASANNDTDEYRLKCSAIDIVKTVTETNLMARDKNSVEYKLEHLSDSHNSLVKKLDSVQVLQFITLILLISFAIIFGFYGYRNCKNGDC